MKSFTVTYHHTCNYGATLQAYALQQYLKNHGIENEVMEYDTLPQRKSQKSRNIRDIIKGGGLKVLGILRWKKHNALKIAFTRFHNDYMIISRKYMNMDDLRNNPPDADILITGSDQVWNLKTNPEMLPARFLNFGKEDALRISYAASIGKLNYSDEDKKTVVSFLQKFSSVSVREKSAAEYIKCFSGIECAVVADPVFLLNKEKWNNIAKYRMICKEPYILCYCVQGNPRLGEVLHNVKAETGYRVVSVNYDVVSRVNADYQLFDVSPQEFLGLFCNASFIITTSFHGTAFALIYGKPFYSLVRNSQDTRISDLLQVVDAADRIVSEESVVCADFTNQDKISSLLNSFVEHSEAFFLKSLKTNGII